MKTSRRRLILAEDDAVYQLILRKLLTRWGYSVELATDGPSAWKRLQKADSPRLAILDWMMPGLDGVEICRKVRARGSEPYTYIILLTGRTDSSDLVAGMDAGADDYLTKPFDAHELRVRLRAGGRIISLQEELLHAQEALRKQATEDSLTGVFNRGSVIQALRKEMERASRDRRPLAVLLADVDHFKRVNDTFGHLAGDAVLVEAARRIQAWLRCYDVLGRWGGEEFLVVSPGCSASGGRRLAERIRRSIAARPFEAGGQSIGITCSIGVSWRGGGAGAEVDALIRDADLALYAAKRSGRNRVEEGRPGVSGLAAFAESVAQAGREAFDLAEYSAISRVGVR